MFSQAEEDVDGCSNWSGFQSLQSEARDSLPSDAVLLVFQGEDDLFYVLEPLEWGVGGEEGVPSKEAKFHEWTEVDCPAMAGALGVLA